MMLLTDSTAATNLLFIARHMRLLASMVPHLEDDIDIEPLWSAATQVEQAASAMATALGQRVNQQYAAVPRQ